MSHVTDIILVVTMEPVDINDYGINGVSEIKNIRNLGTSGH